MAWMKDKLGKVSPWQWMWVLWVLMFFAIELPASANKIPDDTLSEQVWHLIGLHKRDQKPTLAIKAARIGLISFLAWVTYHFFSGGWM